MPTTWPWPGGLVYRDIDLAVDPLNRSAGRALNGGELVVQSGADRWTGQVRFGRVHTDFAPRFAVLASRLRGRFHRFTLPVWLPGPFVEAFPGYRPDGAGGLPMDAGAATDWFDDFTGFGNSFQFTGVAATAAAGETTVTLDIAAIPYAFRAGTFFNLDGWLYRATSVHDLGSDTYLADIEPPLRAAVGAASVFEPVPYLIARLADDASARSLAELHLLIAPTLTFEEAMDR